MSGIGGGMGRRRRGFGPPQPSVETLPCLERTTYRTISETADAITISKTYLLTNAQSSGDLAVLEITGEGTWVFDKRQRVPQSLDFRQTMAAPGASTTTHTRYRLQGSP
jgi:hypothetical protein